MVAVDRDLRAVRRQAAPESTLPVTVAVVGSWKFTSCGVSGMTGYTSTSTWYLPGFGNVTSWRTVPSARDLRVLVDDLREVVADDDQVHAGVRPRSRLEVRQRLPRRQHDVERDLDGLAPGPPVPTAGRRRAGTSSPARPSAPRASPSPTNRMPRATIASTTSATSATYAARDGHPQVAGGRRSGRAVARSPRPRSRSGNDGVSGSAGRLRAPGGLRRTRRSRR